MDFLAWVKSFFAVATPPLPANFTGILLDDRSADEKSGDLQIGELVASAAAVNWAVRTWASFRRFGIQDQDGSGSCVWQTMRKLARVLFIVNRGIDLDFSATYGYRQRTNYPQAGTKAVDVFAIAAAGLTLNAVMPSDDLSEAEMNAAEIKQYHRDIAASFRLPYHVEIPAGDMETVASVIQQTKKAVMVWMYFTSAEWGKDVPTIDSTTLPNDGIAACRHSVAAVDFGIFNGEKGLFIEDSSHFGGKWERFVPEKFYKQRNFFAAYPVNFVFEPGGDTDPAGRPRYNGSTISLQDCLRFEGVFPKNQQSTGVYGPLTTQAVKDFQIKYGLEPVGTVGPKTKAKLEQLYS